MAAELYIDGGQFEDIAGFYRQVTAQLARPGVAGGDNLDALKALLQQYEGAGEVHLEGHLRGYRKGNTDGPLHETHANNRTITHACNCSY